MKCAASPSKVGLLATLSAVVDARDDTRTRRFILTLEREKAKNSVLDLLKLLLWVLTFQ